MRKVTRRALLKSSVAGLAALQVPSTAARNDPTAAKRKGRVHQSVCQWCYPHIPLEELSEYADIVLFDSPPCMLYSDAYLLAPLTDGVLYVVRAGSQDKAAQRRIQRQLQQAKARMLGVVFNDAQAEEVSTSYAYYYPNGHKRK